MPIRTRCHFIGLYGPHPRPASPDGDPTKLGVPEPRRVTWCRERCIEDAEGTKIDLTPTQPGDLSAALADIASTTHTVHDPVTGQDVTFSAAALALWLGVDFDARQAADDARIAAAKAAASQHQEPAP